MQTYLTSSLVAVVLAGAAGSCIPDDAGCNVDDDCGAGLCANTHECLDPGSLMRVELRWTIGGVAVNPNDATACTDAAIERLSVTFRDDDSAEGLATTYDPVPCNLGRMVYTRMPTWFDSLTLVGWSDDGVLANDSGSLAGPETILDLDLVP